MNNLTIRKVTVEHMLHPIGIDCRIPRIGWILENSRDTNVFQESYQIIIRQDGNVVADTGEIRSAASTEITVPGFEAKAKTAYEIQVSVQDNKGNTAYFETGFETGFLGGEWQASWLEPEQIPTEPSRDFDSDEPMDMDVTVIEDKTRDYHEFQPSQYVRIPLQLNKAVKRARTYLTVHGVYHFSINGTRADDREFAPDNTPYHKFIQYQTYDILPFLKPGENVLGVVIGDGWWCGRVGGSGDSCQYGTPLGLLFQTEIEYEDGTAEIFTGENGVSSTGPIIFSDIFVGEKYDARKEMTGWDTPDYDAAGWKTLNKVEYSKDILVGQYGNPVRPVKVLKAKEILHTPAGETVIDFGQVLAGQVEYTVTSEAGREIKLEHTEVLNKEGNYYNNVLGINKDQTDIYITKEGTQTYRPSFTFHGFRYARVTGWPGEPDPENFKVYVLSSEMEILGDFQTSDERINRLQQNIVWSQISNTVSIPTDCPQRERAGWTGDIMAFSPTMCFNRDADTFLTRWMMSLRKDQCPDGAVPDVIPYLKAYEVMNRTFGTDTSCGWGDAVILVPLAVYRAYGDTRILEENYDAMQKWMRYIQGRCENHHPEGYETWDEEHKARSRYLWNTDFHFGDWLVPSMVLGNPDGGAMLSTALATKEYVAPAYYAFSARSMKAVAEALGKEEDVAYYEDLYQKIRSAYITEYVDDEGRMPQELQGLYVIALKNDLVSDEARPKMIAHLKDMIEQNDNCLDTGFLSVLFLMDVLCENGLRDLAYKLLFQTKCPSWLYEVEHGATTMWESWGAVLEDGTVSSYSYNHYAFGCVGEWLYKEIGGLSAKEPGYKTMLINPAYDCGLTSASVSEQTPYGQAKVEWKLNHGKAELMVEVPVNTQAEIVLGQGKVETVGSGSYHFSIAL